MRKGTCRNRSQADNEGGFLQARGRWENTELKQPHFHAHSHRQLGCVLHSHRLGTRGKARQAKVEDREGTGVRLAVM